MAPRPRTMQMNTVRSMFRMACSWLSHRVLIRVRLIFLSQTPSSANRNVRASSSRSSAGSGVSLMMVSPHTSSW